MSAVPIFDHHTGSHRVKREERPSFFRRALRLVLRKPFALAATPARADTALLGDRYDCCEHCLTGAPCEPPNMHLSACSDGCNDTAPALLTTGELAALHHPYPERPTILVRPNGDGAIVIDENNHISIRTLPRKQTPDHPPWDTQAFPAVTDDVPDVATLIEEFGAEQMRAEYVRSQMSEGTPARDRETLRQVLDGLRNLPVYGEVPVARAQEAERLARGLLR